MRVFIAVAGTLAALVIATVAAAAQPTFAKTEGAGSAGPCTVVPPLTGENFCFPRGRDFAFSAVSRGVGPVIRGLGGRANGFYSQASPIGTTLRVIGDVTCLNVVGNTAVFGGVVRPGTVTGSEAERIPFIVYVVDNGEASEGDPPDLISPMGIFPQGDPDRPLVPEQFPRLCPPPVPSIYGYLPVTNGNIVVQEGSVSLP